MKVKPGLALLCGFASAVVFTASPVVSASDDGARLRAQAARVTIVRDDWGIAHVSAATDADAVFGMIYAQAEDDFGRIETNYASTLGRRAPVEGEGAIWGDLRARLYADPVGLKARYAASPAWLKRLMRAWADGLNHYLATHPKTSPRYIARFDPWMALSFTEGSIGGDIERISLKELAAFYGDPSSPVVARLATAERGGRDDEPTGSNGFAIAPANTLNRRALLLINPHTSFYFRAEQQVTSGEGLNAYGAATWGQFFVYQGFNPHLGWMHTSSTVDAVDEFAETVQRRAGRLVYRYGAGAKALAAGRIDVPYRTAQGGQASRRFTIYRTRHGPIVRRAADGRWISIALMNKPVEALSQAFLRTKAADVTAFVGVAERFKANSSNNTLLADDRGGIAYLHPQFIPRRDDRFDYAQPVDGADPATDWRGPTALAHRPHVLNPPNGWVMNTNNGPYSAAAEYSPRRADYPRYMDTVGETPRGLHAIAVLQGRRDFTLESLTAAAFDPAMPAFATLIPQLTAAYDRLRPSDPLRARLAGEIGTLRGWDFRWSADSAATTLAMSWGERLWARSADPAKAARLSVYDWMSDRIDDRERLETLAAASDQLTRDFGTWRTPWGDINRFQRLTDDLVPTFRDDRPSLPVAFTSGRWGSLASFAAKPDPGAKRWYGSSGNSFVAVVEFGLRVRALAVTAGGESGDPASPHFNDQAARYTTGRLREVYFHPDQLTGHTERRYHP